MRASFYNVEGHKNYYSHFINRGKTFGGKGKESSQPSPSPKAYFTLETFEREIGEEQQGRQ